jgi:hypothetical protein
MRVAFLLNHNPILLPFWAVVRPQPALPTLQDPSLKEQQSREAALRAAPKPKPKFDSLTGKWVVMNWDGSVAGVEGGEGIIFANLARDISDVSIPTMSSADPSSLRNTSPFHIASEREGPTSPRGAPAPHHDVGSQPWPFARIDAVADDSPAKKAGLAVEDLVVYFGRLDSHNHNRLRAIAELVPEVAAENGEVTIKVLRQKKTGGDGGTEQDELYDYEDNPEMFEIVEVCLKPQPWSGRGLIGCHIVPYKP